MSFKGRLHEKTKKQIFKEAQLKMQRENRIISGKPTEASLDWKPNARKLPGPRIEPGTHWCKVREEFPKLGKSGGQILLSGHLDGQGVVMSFNSLHDIF